MTDVLTRKQRSYCMSQIRSKNTKPEIALRKLLWNMGYRYRINYKLKGNPDIVFPSKRVAVFVDGCFWHKCPEHFVNPKSNSKFWINKINSNVERDKKVNQELQSMGWKVLRYWEHEIKCSEENLVNKLLQELN